MRKRLVLGIVMALAGTALASAQETQSADPIQCWWRTSAGAVRVGEPFAAVLTCAVIETDAAQAVVDQWRLEPSVRRMPPFEVLGGTHGAEPRTEERRSSASASPRRRS